MWTSREMYFLYLHSWYRIRSPVFTTGLSMKKKGCVNPTECDVDDSETNVSAIMKTRHFCCDSDLCNSAITPWLSAVTGIAVLVALWLFKLS
ncbi:Hypothetical predicted protein [Pelobates cultripes]|uniref:Activin types I and II receptor domain-containing protein n=1 Tax=Pelobates cultripes TaxID=61616 RepID=A0AAD1WM86_PELCU|nr:Hypothetical predicted protein [Pelobates cultripes]